MRCFWEHANRFQIPQKSEIRCELTVGTTRQSVVVQVILQRQQKGVPIEGLLCLLMIDLMSQVTLRQSAWDAQLALDHYNGQAQKSFHSGRNSVSS
jgi:hypothetical protein